MVEGPAPPSAALARVCHLPIGFADREEERRSRAAALEIVTLLAVVAGPVTLP
jgi:hypothetical protein